MAAANLRERIDAPVDARTVIDFVLGAAAVSAGVRACVHRPSDRGQAAAQQFAAPAMQLPGLSIGSAVLSETPGIDGGDIVDVYELDARFALVLVADVCGRGAQAAAQTAFIRYAIRTLALENDGDPAVVLAKFNAMYFRTVKDDEAFVVLILGVIDSQTGEVRYASAGHEPAFIRRRSGRLTMLEPTGPIIGAAAYSAYSSDVVRLESGDMLVWTTDGMTESRDRQRRLLGAAGLARWIAAAPDDAAAVPESLVAALQQRSGNVKGDDVAVLAVAYEAATAGHAPVERRERRAVSRPAMLRKRRLLG